VGVTNVLPLIVEASTHLVTLIQVDVSRNVGEGAWKAMRHERLDAVVTAEAGDGVTEEAWRAVGSTLRRLVAHRHIRNVGIVSLPITLSAWSVTVREEAVTDDVCNDDPKVSRNAKLGG
jgi:hypothetical protein